MHYVLLLVCGLLILFSSILVSSSNYNIDSFAQGQNASQPEDQSKQKSDEACLTFKNFIHPFARGANQSIDCKMGSQSDKSKQCPQGQTISSFSVSCVPCPSTPASIQPTVWDRESSVLKDPLVLSQYYPVANKRAHSGSESEGEVQSVSLRVISIADVICGVQPPPKCPAVYINTPQPSTIISNNTWNYDPNNVLQDPHVNPDLRAHLNRALKAAYDPGIHVKIANGPIGAYRSPQQSDEARANRQPNAAQQLSPIAPGWRSAHNYGLGVDLNIIDEKGRAIQPKLPDGKTKRVDPTGQGRNWYKFYTDLSRYMRAEGFECEDKPRVGGPLDGDSGHFEYHPAWPGLIGVRSGISVDKIFAERDQAMRLAASEGKQFLSINPGSTDWLPYLWSRAGTCPAVDVR